MGKESHTSREICDFNDDKLVGNGKREITIFKIKKFSGNVIWETGFMKRNLRKNVSLCYNPEGSIALMRREADVLPCHLYAVFPPRSRSGSVALTDSRDDVPISGGQKLPTRPSLMSSSSAIVGEDAIGQSRILRL